MLTTAQTRAPGSLLMLVASVFYNESEWRRVLHLFYSLWFGPTVEEWLKTRPQRDALLFLLSICKAQPSEKCPARRERLLYRDFTPVHTMCLVICHREADRMLIKRQGLRAYAILRSGLQEYQESLWLDSVSLLIKDSFEGEMLMIDNLSGSVFHHYSSPPVCKDCRTYPQEQIHMAELEQASLRSEQLSDKSSSPALPDDLSLDEQSVYQMAARESKDRGCDECLTSEEPGRKGHSRLQRPCRLYSSGAEEGATGPGPGFQSPYHCHNTPARHSIGGVPCSSSNQEYTGLSGGSSGSNTPIRLPAEFFHPAAAALPAPPRGRLGHKPRGLRLTSPASWASLRSPGANTRLLTTQYPSHSDSSLATGSSEGSLATTMEEGLSFIVSASQNPELPLPLLDTLLDERTSLSTETLRPSPPAAQNLHTTRGHQRSKSSCGTHASAGSTRQDPIDPSDEDIGMVQCSSNQTCDSQQLSETLSSLSLTSLLLPSSLAPASVKKCNSTGSLEQGTLTTQEMEGRHVFAKESQDKLTSPWKDRKKGGRGGQSEATQGKDGESSSQITIVGSSKNR